MAKLTNPHDNPNTRKLILQFHALCGDYAAKVHAKKIDLHHGVDACQNFAVGRGLPELIGQDAVQDILTQAFKQSRHGRK
jgi:hypothetical protein